MIIKSLELFFLFNIWCKDVEPFFLVSMLLSGASIGFLPDTLVILGRFFTSKHWKLDWLVFLEHAIGNFFILIFVLNRLDAVSRKFLQEVWRTHDINEQEIQLLFLWKHLLEPIQLNGFTEHQNEGGVFTLFNGDSIWGGNKSGPDKLEDSIDERDIDGGERVIVNSKQFLHGDHK